jgi:hypothetical protein
MTLVAYKSGVSIQTVEFETYEQCNATGQAWVQNVPKASSGHYQTKASIVCAESKR